MRRRQQREHWKPGQVAAIRCLWPPIPRIHTAAYPLQPGRRRKVDWRSLGNGCSDEWGTCRCPRPLHSWVQRTSGLVPPDCGYVWQIQISQHELCTKEIIWLSSSIKLKSQMLFKPTGHFILVLLIASYELLPWLNLSFNFRVKRCMRKIKPTVSQLAIYFPPLFALVSHNGSLLFIAVYSLKLLVKRRETQRPKKIMGKEMVRKTTTPKIPHCFMMSSN